MRVTLNRALCRHHPAACEDCFAQFLQTGEQPPGGCITEVVDTGEPELVVKVVTGNQTGTLVVTNRNRDEVIYNGWMRFIRMPYEESVRTDGSQDRRGRPGLNGT